MVKKISGKEFDEAREKEVAVVDFSATWCGPCQMIAPVLEEISQEMEGKVSFYNVDVDENPELAQEFEISSIPALVLLEKGEKKRMQVGFQPKAGLLQFINNL